jgi:cytochrome c biogenesis protein CcdA
MLGLALLVASIAVADSINPSTIVPALWLASVRSAAGLMSYTLGVFVVYTAGGLVILFGPGRVLIASLHQLQGPVEHSLEAAGGSLALAFAFALWRSRGKTDARPVRRRPQTRVAAFALGAGIMSIELPTAFMYFGAVSAILAGHQSAAVEVTLVAGYNALFVAPLVAIVAVRHVAGIRADRWIESAELRLRYVGQLLLSGIAAAAGAALLSLGLVGLLIA